MTNTFKKIGLSLLVASSLYGATPITINFQGFLKDSSGTAISANKSIVFSLYTVASGGSSIWNSTKTVTVTDGVYSTVLGDTTALTGLAFDTQYYLGINVAGDGEMTPRQPLTSTAYAIKAKQLDVAYTLPTADGTNGQVLKTNGSGSATWQNSGGLSIHYYTASITTSKNWNAVDYVYVSCTQGSPIGGGFYENYTNAFAVSSCPATSANSCNASSPTGWSAGIVSDTDQTFKAYVICAE